MKHFFFFAIILLMAFTATWQPSTAQILNADFEMWTMGNPDDWNTSNSPGFAVNITESSVAHSGGSAVDGVVADFGGGFPWPPVIISGTNAEGFPVNMRHEAVHGWYQCSLLGADGLLVYVAMVQGDSGVGGGAILINQSTSVYTEFVANITYISSLVPDTCIISATIANTGGGFPQIGSSFLLDDLSFGPLSAVDETGNLVPEDFSLSQNYPNPFNPRTTIEYSLPTSGLVSLGVYDLLGREVSRLVDEEQSAGVHRVDFDGSDLASGVYLYRLQAGDFSEVRSLVLLK